MRRKKKYNPNSSYNPAMQIRNRHQPTNAGKTGYKMKDYSFFLSERYFFGDTPMIVRKRFEK